MKQKAEPTGAAGAFRFGGAIKAKGPRALVDGGKGLALEVEDGPGIELDLEIKFEDCKPALEKADIMAWLCDAEATISSEVSTDGERTVDGTTAVFFKDKAGGGLELVLSIDQAKAAAELLTAYVEAHGAISRLGKVYVAGTGNNDRS